MAMEESRGILLVWDIVDGEPRLFPKRISELYEDMEKDAGSSVWAIELVPVACFDCGKYIHYPPVQLPLQPPEPKEGGSQPHEWVATWTNHHIHCAFEHLVGIRASDLNTERKQ
jgi:hypothetical protein